MERVITCPCCFNDDKCFEEIISDTMSSFLCFNCGMTTNSLYKSGSKEQQRYTEIAPELIKQLEFYDEERELCWYPTVLQMGSLGIIFPEGTVDQWSWKYAKVVDIPKEEQHNFPISGSTTEFYETRLDIDNATSYNRYNFFDAVRDMGIIKSI